jgi:hypothetical protein
MFKFRFGDVHPDNLGWLLESIDKKVNERLVGVACPDYGGVSTQVTREQSASTLSYKVLHQCSSDTEGACEGLQDALGQAMKGEESELCQTRVSMVTF